MKSQQTLKYSTTHHHSVSQSTSHTMTSNDYHEWSLTSNRRFTTYPLRLFSHSHSQRNRNRDRDIITSCHIRQYSHWQSTRGHHLPRGENHGGWCPVGERLTLALIVDRHMITGDQWRSLEITENHSVTVSYRRTSTGTVWHRHSERSSEEHGLSHRVHVTLGGEWHWVMILMAIGYRGWWVSLGGC